MSSNNKNSGFRQIMKRKKPTVPMGEGWEGERPNPSPPFLH